MPWLCAAEPTNEPAAPAAGAAAEAAADGAQEASPAEEAAPDAAAAAEPVPDPAAEPAAEADEPAADAAAEPAADPMAAEAPTDTAVPMETAEQPGTGMHNPFSSSVNCHSCDEPQERFISLATAPANGSSLQCGIP